MKVCGISSGKFAEFLHESLWSFSASFREVSRNIANLREISRSFLCESSRLRLSVHRVNAKKELFSWADLYNGKRLSPC